MGQACCADCDSEATFGADPSAAAVGAPQPLWVTNAVKTAGRQEGTGKASMSPNGKISGAVDLPHTNVGRTPKLNDEAMLRYFANLGYIDVHDDPTALAGALLFPDPTGFYIGLGLMMHRTGAKQFLTVRKILSPDAQKAFDAAVSMHIARVVSDAPIPKSNFFNPFKSPPPRLATADVGFGDDVIDVDGNIDVGAAAGQLADAKTANIAGKLQDGDYGAAAESAGGSLAEGAAIGGAVAGATGTIVAAGAAIGTAIPIPVVGTAVGAAVGAAVAGIIVLANAIGGSAPDYNEDDYTHMKQACKAAGGDQVYGVPPDQDKACRFPDGSTSGGFQPTWDPVKKASYQAEEAARKVQLDNLGSYTQGLKSIDTLIANADKAMRAPGAGVAQRNVWMKQIGDAFAKVYTDTKQTDFAPLNVAGFIADIQKRVYMPPADLFKGTTAKKLVTLGKAVAANKAAPKPAPMPGKATAGYLITQGLIGATPAQKVPVVQTMIQDPVVKQGVVTTIKEVAAAREGFFHKILRWLHLAHA